jgi:hypothetical protein
MSGNRDALGPAGAHGKVEPSPRAVEKGIDGAGAADKGTNGAAEKRPADERLAINVEVVVPKTKPKFGALAVSRLGCGGGGCTGAVPFPSPALPFAPGLVGVPAGLKGKGGFDANR